MSKFAPLLPHAIKSTSAMSVNSSGVIACLCSCLVMASSLPARRGRRESHFLHLCVHNCIHSSNQHLRHADRKSKMISFQPLQRTFPASPCAPRQAARAGYPRALSSAGLLARAARRTRGRGGGGGGGGREP